VRWSALGEGSVDGGPDVDAGGRERRHWAVVQPDEQLDLVHPGTMPCAPAGTKRSMTARYAFRDAWDTTPTTNSS